MIPVRLTLGGSTLWRHVPTLEHADLCRAFNLDQATYWFDLPRTAYRHDLSKERVSGYVMRGETPAGTLHVALEGERFRDLDPQTERLELRQTDRN